LRKLPIGFRQILGTDDRGQVSYLEGRGHSRWTTGWIRLDDPACRVLADTVRDLLPGLLLSVFLA
jgi:hypothetical protein